MQFGELFRLSWTHYTFLIKIENEDERNFYEIETTNNNWSVRELQRQYNSSLYERIALSKNKKKVKELSTKGQIVTKPIDMLKEPYILEFLGLKEEAVYTETELETALINKLENFLLELGKGFLFQSRQQRISFDGENFYIDLVFYNRILKCFVLIDLKIGEVEHQDIGQMQMYVNFYDREIKTKEENKTVGLVLCKQTNKAVVEYTLPEKNDQIFA
jgi:predicted nuclease of restriction endonuclease-like (RecB) superfamily